MKLTSICLNSFKSDLRHPWIDACINISPYLLSLNFSHPVSSMLPAFQGCTDKEKKYIETRKSKDKAANDKELERLTKMASKHHVGS